MLETKTRTGAQKISEALAANPVVKAVFPNRVGVNYAIAIIMVLGGIFVNFPTEEAKAVATQIFGGVAGLQFFYTYFKNAKLDFLAWIKNENTFASIATLLLTFNVVLPDGLIEQLGRLTQAILNRDASQIIQVVLYLGTILINLLRKPK
jgi:hypothetical protein